MLNRSSSNVGASLPKKRLNPVFKKKGSNMNEHDDIIMYGILQDLSLFNRPLEQPKQDTIL